MPTTIRYSIEPNPPKAGKSAKVCYDFAGSGTTSAPTTIKWVPDTIPATQFTLTSSEPCREIIVPAGATEGFATDDGGHSGDLAFFVT